MTDPREKRDELIVRLLAAGLETRDPELSEMMERDPSLRDEAQAVLEFEADLLARPDEVEWDLRAAATDEAHTLLDTERVERILERGEPEGTSSAGGGALLRFWAAAAAVLLGGVLLTVAIRPWESPNEPVLPWTPLGGEIECIRPLGDGADFTTFEWRVELEPGEESRVIVYDREGAEIARSPLSESTTWMPENPIDWPQEIRWHVLIIDAGDTVVAQGQLQDARSD